MKYVLTALFLIALPGYAHADGISQVAGLFNILAGLMLVVSFLLFFGGLGMWMARLGTFPTYRDDAIVMMQWGVAILFVLAALLALVQFIQKNTDIAYMILGGVVVAVGIWIALTVAAQKPDEDEH
jgi:hypothetical protein